MTGTLLDDRDRVALVARLRGLRSDTRPRWGTLDAPRMLCHLVDQLRVALGDLPSALTGTVLHRTLVKWLVVYTPIQPPPGKVQTAPEMLVSAPRAWEQDLTECEALIERVGAGNAAAVHPAFGPLNAVQWGRVCWKHLDHHLRQFGQ